MDFKSKQTFRIFWQHARRYPGLILLLTIGLLGATAAESFGPYFYKQLFNLLAANAPVAPILMVVTKILAAAAVAWLFWRLATFVNNVFQPSIMRDLLNTCFNYLHRHSFNFFSNNFAGSLVKKIGRYERAFEDITDQIYWSLLPTTLKLTIVAVILFSVNPIFGWAVLAWTAVYVAYSVIFALYKLKYDIQNSSLDTEFGGRLADT